MDTDRFTDTVVLPTPPLPPVTAMTLTGRVALSSASTPARYRRESGFRHAPVLRQWGCAKAAGSSGATRSDFSAAAPAHQPNAHLQSGLKILRDSLAIADIGDIQPMAQRGGNHPTETRGLVHLVSVRRPTVRRARRIARSPPARGPRLERATPATHARRAHPSAAPRAARRAARRRGPMPAVSIRTSFFVCSRSKSRDRSAPLLAACMGAPSNRA